MLELTVGERLRVLRRRNRLTQAQVADHYHVSQMTISMWENDAVPFAGIVNEILDLHSGEECYILRRRLGLHIKKVATEIGVSHVTLLKWEREGTRDARYRTFLQERFAEKDREELS